MTNRKVNVGCGGAILIGIGLMAFVAALIYADDHMDALASIIVGAIIISLVLVIMVRSK